MKLNSIENIVLKNKSKYQNISFFYNSFTTKIIKFKDKLPSIYINQRENNLIYQKIFS